MSIISGKKVGQVQFCKPLWPIWTASAAAIGLSTAQAGAFKTLTSAARAAFTLLSLLTKAGLFGARLFIGPGGGTPSSGWARVDPNAILSSLSLR